MNLYEKLSAIQSKLKAPKNQYNSFGKYNYRSCEDILEGLKPLLLEYKATVTLSDEIKQIGDRYYLEATAKAKNLRPDLLIDGELQLNTVVDEFRFEFLIGLIMNRVANLLEFYYKMEE